MSSGGGNNMGLCVVECMYCPYFVDYTLSGIAVALCPGTLQLCSAKISEKMRCRISRVSFIFRIVFGQSTERMMSVIRE